MKTVKDIIEELKKFPGETIVTHSVAFSYKHPFLRAQGDFTEIMKVNSGEVVFLGDGGTNENYEECD